MYLYSFSGLTLASDALLPELPSVEPSEEKAPDISFRQLDVPFGASCDEDASEDPARAGALVPRLIRIARGYLLSFPGLAEFLVDEDGRRVSARSLPDTAAETLRHLLLDQVLPRVLAWRGRLVLHSGAVRVGERVVAFLGGTGTGKSTLVASLHAAGHPALTDDGLVVVPSRSGALAFPTYVGLRLWPDSAFALLPEAPSLGPLNPGSPKRRVGLETGPAGVVEPSPLAALFEMGEALEAGSEAVSLERLSPRDGCMAIIANSFQLDPTDRTRASRLLHGAAEVASSSPVFRLSCLRDYSLLPQVRRAILESRSEWAGGPGGAMNEGCAR